MAVAHREMYCVGRSDFMKDEVLEGIKAGYDTIDTAIDLIKRMK